MNPAAHQYQYCDQKCQPAPKIDVKKAYQRSYEQYQKEISRLFLEREVFPKVGPASLLPAAFRCFPLFPAAFRYFPLFPVASSCFPLLPF